MSTTQQAGDGASQVEQEKPPRAPQQSRTHDLRNQLPAHDYAVLVAIFNGALATALLARKCSREPFRTAWTQRT